MDDVNSLWPVRWRKGETVVQISPGGVESPLVEAAAEPGSANVAIDAAGLWMLRNSRQGTVEVTVRHSIYGTQGAGTAESPASIVDAGELADLHSAGTAGDGYVFTLAGAGSLFATLVRPEGFRLEELEGGLWRMVASDDGSVYRWAGSVAYRLDTVLPGPNRITKKNGMPISYTGDNWVGDRRAGSVLTLTSPSGDAAVHALSGTGAQPVVFGEGGDWLVTLDFGGRTLSASIFVQSTMAIIIR